LPPAPRSGQAFPCLGYGSSSAQPSPPNAEVQPPGPPGATERLGNPGGRPRSAAMVRSARISTMSRFLLGVRRRPSLMPTGISRVVGEKPRRLTPRLAVQVTNATNLARVISEVRGLVIRQHVSESLTRYCFAVGRCTLIL